MTEWPVWKRIAFRFGVVFGALELLPFPLLLVPRVGDWLDDQWTAMWLAIVDAFGRNVLGTGPITIVSTGSGDNLFGYVQLLVFVLLATLATVAWSIADRRRPAYPRLAAAGRIVLRYFLGTAMLIYGCYKVRLLQFRAPSGPRLFEPVGHMSPMGMLWTFMGASSPSEVFGGLMECVGGVLLLWRRTTLVGALVLAPVLVNVVMLNFCYDVPVKLYSSELLIVTLVLIRPDLRRLAAVVLGREAPAATPDLPWPPRWRLASRIVKVMILVGIAYTLVHGPLATVPDKPNSLVGAWQVDRVVRDGVEAPPLATDGTRWKLLVVANHSALIRTMDDRDRTEPIAKLDDTQLQLGTLALAATRTGDHLVLSGAIDGHETLIELHARDDSDMLLVHRGFHWIQEQPFNR